MDTSDILSIISLVISLLTIIVTLITYVNGIRRDKKQATLDAFDNLQHNVLDELNKLSKKDIEEILCHPRSEKYKYISQLMARCEQFSVGVNTNIYDITIVISMAGRYLIALYRNKLNNLVEKYYEKDGKC